MGRQNCKKIFVKDTLGEVGRLIYAYTNNGQNEFYNNQDKLSAWHISTVYKDMNVIVQEGIVQSSNLAKINADSVNTIRVITGNINGEVVLLAAMMRFGRQGSFIDNAHAGGFFVKVDIPTGILRGPAKRYHDINNYYEHPDSKIIFDGTQIPRWEEAKALVVKAATAFHEFKYMGWDVVVTEQDVMILEMNHDFGVGIQSVVGGLADKFKV
ncbi:MAG: sugar-transfer associated ATP-grasp domain-containing protein [Candidatus Cloacimonetes bacterium]|nr:sugar-transfer associated ATP-grasp domain-containing protein [Candidatus Cloacimonadota bacterium]